MTRSIFCDESGYTGPNLLDEQRFYVYASVAMAHDLVGKVGVPLWDDGRTHDVRVTLG